MNGNVGFKTAVFIVDSNVVSDFFDCSNHIIPLEYIPQVVAHHAARVSAQCVLRLQKGRRSPRWFDFACFDNAQHRHHRSRG